jgi:predicted metal-dependent phosphoesterase TrpH
MPARQPFTSLCQTLNHPRTAGRSDLHLHSTYSDGTYTPAQVVELARRSGLAAIALTDHDTVAGVSVAQEAAGNSPEVVSGVEITAEYEGRELHLLGYFVRLDDPPLLAGLRRLGEARVGRFWEMVERLRACGLKVRDEELRPHVGPGVLGRRRLAELLVRLGKAGSVRQVFTRYLSDNGLAAVPKERLPVAEAIALVRGAGGVAAWAHPSYHGDRGRLLALRQLGLGAVEAEYPAHRPALVRELRGLAAELGLAVTGGSDCHGPEPAGRAVGARTVTAPELERLRQLASP